MFTGSKKKGLGNKGPFRFNERGHQEDNTVQNRWERGRSCRGGNGAGRELTGWGKAREGKTCEKKKKTPRTSKSPNTKEKKKRQEGIVGTKGTRFNGGGKIKNQKQKVCLVKQGYIITTK